VIDKDFASMMIGAVLYADILMILTDVEHVYTNWADKAKRKKLGRITVSEAKEYIRKGEFGEGSMGPKVQAAVDFVERTHNVAIITSLDKAVRAVNEGSGTHIVPD